MAPELVQGGTEGSFESSETRISLTACVLTANPNMGGGLSDPSSLQPLGSTIQRVRETLEPTLLRLLREHGRAPRPRGASGTYTARRAQGAGRARGCMRRRPCCSP